MKEIVKNTLIITAITLVAGILLGSVYMITKKPIKKQKELAKTEACRSVFADAASFEDAEADMSALGAYLGEKGFTAQTVDEVMEAKDDADNSLGYVLTVTSSEGYGGDITFAMGVTGEGTVNGISFLAISETAGLGMKADTEDFKKQFAGKNTDSFTYTKAGAAGDNEIDSISGATVTTEAVISAANAGLAAVDYLKGGM